MKYIVPCALWGLLLTLFVGHLDSKLGNPLSRLRDMKSGQAYQPFVRRQLVPLLIGKTEGLMPLTTRQYLDEELGGNHAAREVMFPNVEASPTDTVLCLLIWFVSFTVFAYVLYLETIAYVGDVRLAALLTGITCVAIVPLFHNNYIYDPTTLACAAGAMRALRKESLVALAIVTAVFTLNRETAFIVPGMTFFYWIFRSDLLFSGNQVASVRSPGRGSDDQSRSTKRHYLWKAFFWASLLSVVYFVVEIPIIRHFRNNRGVLAQNNFHYLIRLYTHKNLPFAIIFILAAAFYFVMVIRYYRKLPYALLAVQPFVPVWIGLHIIWGWPMEWRVFYEIVPGVALTCGSIWSQFRHRRVVVS
jgi:hypothetical protein